MKRVVFILYLLLVIILGLCACTKERNNGYQTGDDSKRYVKESFIDKSNDWIYFIHVTKYENESKLEFFFDGINMKYKKLKGYYIPTYDNSGNEIGQNEANPKLSNSRREKREVERINNFLNREQFTSDITIKDLEKLELDIFSKNDIVKLINKLNDVEYIDVDDDSDMLYLSYYDNVQMRIDNNTILQFAYYNPAGGVQRIHTDIIYNNDGKEEYLSDRINGENATKQQKELYSNLEQIGDYIIKNQTFAVRNKFKNLKGKEYNVLFKHLNNMNASLQKR